MLKSEAFEKLITISDDTEHGYETFIKQYGDLATIVKEYPELSDYVLAAVVQTTANDQFNGDLAPRAREIFIKAAKNISAENALNHINRALSKNEKFMLATLPELFKTKPEMAAALFPRLIKDAGRQNADGIGLYIGPLGAAVYEAPDNVAATMLKDIFGATQENPLPGEKLYPSLGGIYSKHPRLKEIIFSLLADARFLSSRTCDSFYANLAQIAIFEHASFAKTSKMIGEQIVKAENTPLSLTAAYQSIARLIISYPQRRKELEKLIKTGLRNPANDVSSQKEAWRILNDYDNLCSKVSLGQRIAKSSENKFGWKGNAKISPQEVCLLVLGGNKVRSEKEANGYLGSIYRLLESCGLQNEVNVYGAVYDFGDYMDVGTARTRLMEEYKHKRPVERRLHSETLNPKYIRQIFNEIVLPRLSDEEGASRLDAAEAATRIRRLNIFAHCQGAYTALRLEEMMQAKMKELGYTPEERQLIQQQLLVLAQSPDCPLGESLSTFISFAAAADDSIRHYNNFDKAVRQIVREENIPLSFLPGKQGNLFLIGSYGENCDQHCFNCFLLPDGLSDEGKAITLLSAKLLINGVKNSLAEAPRLPSVRDLAAGSAESAELFETAFINGKQLYQKIMRRSAGFYRNRER